MAYDKHTWQCGEAITVGKLNHIENGIEECCGGGGRVAVVHLTYDQQQSEFTADMTCDEIVEFLGNGGILFAEYDELYYPMVHIDPSIFQPTTREQLRAATSPWLVFGITYIDDNLVKEKKISFYPDCTIGFLESSVSGTVQSNNQ